jgi:hypothetical protein
MRNVAMLTCPKFEQRAGGSPSRSGLIPVYGHPEKWSLQHPLRMWPDYLARPSCRRRLIPRIIMSK